MLKISALSVKDIVANIPADDQTIVHEIDKMLREGKISISESGKVEIIE